MARGHQKIQSQAKAAEKQAKMKKQQGHSANDQKKAAQKALVHVCVLCKVRSVQSILNIFKIELINTTNLLHSHKCRIPRLTSSILRTSIPKTTCPRS